MVRDDGSLVHAAVGAGLVGGRGGGRARGDPDRARVHLSDYATLPPPARQPFATLSARAAHPAGPPRRGPVAPARDPRRDRQLARSARQDLEPFGPEAGPAKRGVGIGGGQRRRGSRWSPIAPQVARTWTGCSGVVKEEGESIRTLERSSDRASRVLASLPSRWPVRGPVNSDFGQRRSPWAPNYRVPQRHRHRGRDRYTGEVAPPPAPWCSRASIRSTAHPHHRTTATTQVALSATCRGLSVGLEPAGAAGGGRWRSPAHRTLLRPAPALRDPGQGPAGEPAKIYIWEEPGPSSPGPPPRR